MALGHSPRIVTDGLVLALDAANRKSYIGAVTTSLINTNSWTVSSGTVSGYNCNGSTNENVRSYDTDPWGNQSLIWGTFADGSGGADGGWNTDYPSIDPTKLYRFSVWVRRTSSTSAGTFYFGTGAGGAEVMGTSDSATKGNPYWECSNVGVLTQNQWYLCCGHVYPHFTTYTGRHPNTGYFTVAGGITKVMDVNGCNIGSDLKWNPASSSAVHRTYHYYCGDATTRLQFLAPRMDVCDGREPSILELLTNGVSVMKDTSGSNRSTVLINTPYSANLFTFNGSTSYFNHGVNSYNLGVRSAASFCGWVKPTDTGGIYILSDWNANQGMTLRTDSLTSITFYAYDGTDHRINIAYTFVIGQWYYIVAVIAGSTNYLYINGVLVGSVAFNAILGNSASTLKSGTRGDGTGGATGCISNVSMYTKALSQTEITQNFNALRGRYGI